MPATLVTKYGDMRIQFGGGGPDHLMAWAGSSVNAPDSPDHVPYVSIHGVRYQLRIDLHFEGGAWVVKKNSPVTGSRADDTRVYLSRSAETAVFSTIIPAMVEWAESHTTERRQAERDWLSKEMRSALQAETDAQRDLDRAQSRVEALVARVRLLAQEEGKS